LRYRLVGGAGLEGAVRLALALLFLLAVPVAAQEATPSDVPGTPPAASPEPTPAPGQEPTPASPVYVVQPGDTLYTIAQRFGSTVEAIVAANDIADPSVINVGQKLIIPTDQPELVPSPEPRPDTRLHPVRPGEVLPSLAFRYGTTVWTLREVNELAWLSPLPPGQRLVIPPATAAISDTAAFPGVAASPAPVVQGQTMVIEVAGEKALALRGSFLGQDLIFVGEEDRYWALVGVDALTPAGPYPLTLTITETQSGDLLSMQETFSVTKGDYGSYNVVVPADRQNLLDPVLAREEREKVDAAFAGVSAERLWAGVFGFPLAGELRTTAPFGQRRSYNSGPVSSYHTGHDYGADSGTPVMAPVTATVVLAEPLQVRGKVVILDHGQGVFTGFWHLSEIMVQAGQVVGQGEVVGLVGNTGLSTGPHLHWEMRVYGVPVDPLQWTRRTFP
jgi:murein DD-endopeptidase MepM/ murein hydrolase activator NlpD